jgi:hypothetical protein
MCLYVLIVVFLNSYIVFLMLIVYVYFVPLVILMCPSLCVYGLFSLIITRVVYILFCHVHLRYR